MTLSTSIFAERFPTSDAIVTLIAEEKEFPVHKCILAAASPFFADMFSLPQPDSSTFKEPILTTESACVLEILLQFLYPIPNPTISDLDTLVAVLTAAVKYEFEHVVDSLRRTLVAPSFLAESPLRVFAIACRFDFDEEAKIASRKTLQTNLIDSPLNDDLKHINAYAYHRLLGLHRDRSRQACDIIKTARTSMNAKLAPCAQCSSTSFMTAIPRWWTEYEKRACNELSQRPTTHVIFGMEFLANVASDCGCSRCPASLLSSHGFLETLKTTLDDLVATI